jgi:hypothetical protein
MTRHARRMLLLLAITSLVLTPAVRTSNAASNQDVALGHLVYLGFQDIDFNARSSAFGTDARGHFRVTVTGFDPNQVYEGEVLCLQVVGTATAALATIGGVITRAPAGNTAQGFVAFASDSGKFSQGADTFDWTITTLPTTVCPTPTLGTPVVDGEIVIRDAQ